MHRIMKCISFILILVFLRVEVALAADQVFFYYTDPVGTPLVTSDSSGNIAWKADYMPFGEELLDTSTVENNKMFVGKEKDKETSLYYFGARYMEPMIGRFISPDHIGPVDPQTGDANELILRDPQRINFYAYGLSNPNRYVDTDGNIALEIPALVFGTLVIFALWAQYVTTHQQYQKYLSEAKKPEHSGRSSGKSPTEQENSGPKAKDAPGQTASGQATDEYGNKLGPSGEPMVNRVKHPSKKAAKDAARREGDMAPVKHPSPKKGEPHYHPSDRLGEKMPGSTHHEH